MGFAVARAIVGFAAVEFALASLALAESVEFAVAEQRIEVENAAGLPHLARCPTSEKMKS